VAAFADKIRVSDLVTALPLEGAPNEEVIPCDLSDKQAVDALVAGCDAVIHLGGVSVERPFEEVLEANIKGVYNLYEGARRHGV
jgi:uronate dehydrogenase